MIQDEIFYGRLNRYVHHPGLTDVQTIYGKSSSNMFDSSQLESVTVEPTKEMGFSYPVGQILPDGTIMAIPKLHQRWSEESGEIIIDRARPAPLQRRKSFREALITKPVSYAYCTMMELKLI